MNESPGRPNPFGCFDRRYLIELIPAIAAIVAALVIAASVPRSHSRQLLMAGLASGALAWMFVVTVAAIRRLDELQQRIQLIGIAIAFVATGALVSLTLFFRVADVGWVPSETELVMFMMLVWAGAVVVLNHRYR
jgi:hypothetical protein